MLACVGGMRVEVRSASVAKNARARSRAEVQIDRRSDIALTCMSRLRHWRLLTRWLIAVTQAEFYGACELFTYVSLAVGLRQVQGKLRSSRASAARIVLAKGL